MDKVYIKELINYISPNLRECLKNIETSRWIKAEEIRITIGKPAMLCYNDGFEYIYKNNEPFICDAQSINETLMLITENSIYAANDKLVNGFITLKGGHRAGVCGSAVINGGKISAIKDISSINIRIKREMIGAADKVIKYIICDGQIQNTLIISPPQCGKTTLLRDIARTLGRNRRVSIVDERSEIAAMYNGVAQNDIGLCTNVLDNCPKAEGIPLVIRSMSPEVVVTDEIGGESDTFAINYAASSGVKIITSAHGGGLNDLIHRRTFKNIIDFFDVFIVLTNIGGTGSISNIIRRSELDI